MASIEILGTGRIDERESAFPQAVQLPDGDILCSFNVGGGAHATGGSDWARSTDGGETWEVEGTLLPRKEGSTNALKLSLSADGRTVYAYGSRHFTRATKVFGDSENEPVFLRSSDGGRTWSGPRSIPMNGHRKLEISHGILPLRSGRLLAPAATLDSQGHVGQAGPGRRFRRRRGDVAAPCRRVRGPGGERLGYLEQKLAQTDEGLLIATCWTVTLGDVVDEEDSFVISRDDGLTWSAPRSTGIRGQTMTPIPLGGNRLLVLYNRRYGDQGIVMNLVTFSPDGWEIHYEGLMYDPGTRQDRPAGLATGSGGVRRLPVRVPHRHPPPGRRLPGHALVPGRGPVRRALDPPEDRLVGRPRNGTLSGRRTW